MSELLSPQEACKLLGVAARTMYQLAAPGGPIPCIRTGLKRRKVVFCVAVGENPRIDFASFQGVTP